MDNPMHLLVYLVDKFDSWKEENMPDTSTEVALSQYPGVTSEDCNSYLDGLKTWSIVRKVLFFLKYGWI